MALKVKRCSASVVPTEEIVLEIDQFCRWFIDNHQAVLSRENIKENEYRFLRLFLTNGAFHRTGDIAVAIRQDPGHVGRVLRQMEDRGWVSLDLDAKDRRKTGVQVTEGGEQVLERCNWQRNCLAKRLLENTSAEKQRAVLSLFKELNRLAEDMCTDLFDDLFPTKARTAGQKERKRRPVIRKKGRGGFHLGGTAEVKVGRGVGVKE